MARHTTDRFCTSCGSCRTGTVDPYTGEVLVEVEIHAIPDDIVDPGPPDVSPGWLALAKVAGCGPDGPPAFSPRVDRRPATVHGPEGWTTMVGMVATFDPLPDGPVYRDECRPGHRCLGGCYEGERCRSEVEREQRLAVDGLGRFLRGLA